MRYFVWLLQFLVFLLFLGFALHNRTPVSLKFFLGYEWQSPLIGMLLVFFCIGVGCGLLGALSQMLRFRREILALKKELRARASQAPALPQQPDLLV